MTQSERDAAIGGLMARLSASRQEGAAILALLMKYRGLFKSLSDLCDGCLHDHAMKTAAHDVPEDLPTSTQLASLLTDLRRTTKEVEECQALLREYGVI
jgi:hypothetical protein